MHKWGGQVLSLPLSHCSAYCFFIDRHSFPTGLFVCVLLVGDARLDQSVNDLGVTVDEGSRLDLANCH
jgi:hypothetical protein